MTPLAESLARSPEIFPHTLELQTDSVSLVRLTEADYGRASFLDARILGPQAVTRNLPWAQLEAATAETAHPEACDFILHIGHVGSTLLSRLLGRHSAVFGLREPAILRTLAQMRAEPEAQPRAWSAMEFEARTSTFLKLWSRTFHPEQRAVVKATSFASELAAEILARPYAPKAIFMTVSPENYLATILGAEHSPQEARLLASSRLNRLHRRLGASAWNLSALSQGEMVAMSWACEMTALAAAASSAGDRVLWLNFDRFLADPQSVLAKCFRHLSIDASADQVGAILAGPDMRTYSKAQEYDYDAKLRADVLERARSQYGAEIERGLLWLKRAAAQFAIVETALRTASSG